MSSVTNYGQLGQVQGGSSAYTFWPAPALDINGDPIPPLMNYVFGWGLWVGAQVRNDSIPGKMDTLVTQGYNPSNARYEYTPGAVIGGVPQSPTAADVKVYVSTEAGWPLQKTGGGDSIVSMLDTRCVYNDYNVSNHLTGRPLKIEVTQTTYQWNTASITDVIYYLFEVRNTREDTLFDVYLAPTTDCDIGSESDPYQNDICYWDSTTNMGYQYNGINSEPGWTREPGCIGFMFLESPVANKEFTAPDGYHLSIGDTIGLYAFKVFNRAIDPPTDIEQYQELAGYDYMTGNFKRLDNKPSPNDQRFMESTGPIDLAPGQTAKVIVCMICANFDYSYLGTNDTMAIMELREKARDAKLQFDQLGITGLLGKNTMPPILLLQNAPNPFKQATTINYRVSKPGLVNLKVYNIAGQLVKTLASGQAAAGPHAVKWDGRDNSGNKVSSGIYIYRLQAENKEMTQKLVILR
ncbi:T9SS type A sorting domain-containing protein [candidate division TA06 bacterium]|nr:T9SS type A sorting domain-containing protein [candidate division TA06 bacterium]